MDDKGTSVRVLGTGGGVVVGFRGFKGRVVVSPGGWWLSSHSRVGTPTTVPPHSHASRHLPVDGPRGSRA